MHYILQIRLVRHSDIGKSTLCQAIVSRLCVRPVSSLVLPLTPRLPFFY